MLSLYDRSVESEVKLGKAAGLICGMSRRQDRPIHSTARQVLLLIEDPERVECDSADAVYESVVAQRSH